VEQEGDAGALGGQACRGAGPPSVALVIMSVAQLKSFSIALFLLNCSPFSHGFAYWDTKRD
jgi:hypothetical protein